MLILKSSKIHNVGVFTTTVIKQNVNPFVGVPDDSCEIKKVSRSQQRYCIWDKNKKTWNGPKNFNRMAIWWYLNHSKNPNISVSSWRSTRKIKAGEELTIDYREFKER